MKFGNEVPVEAKELLNNIEKEISESGNKLMFLIYGVIGKYGKIRDIVNFKEPKEDEIEKFIEICDNRIEGLKSFSQDLITSLSILIAFFGGILAGVFLLLRTNETFHISFNLIFTFIIILILFAIFLFAMLLFIVLGNYKAQIHPWYAVKEGVLLMKKNKKK